MSDDDLKARLAAIDWRDYPGGQDYRWIPENIIALRDPSERERRAAAEMLERCLVPQASMTEVACCALPFLVELACAMPDHAPLFGLIGIIAQCSAFEDSGVAGYDVLFENKRYREHEFAALCRARISVGFDTYLEVLTNRGRSREVRSEAITILSSLREQRNRWLPLMRQLLVDDPDPGIRQHLASVIANARRPGE